MNKSILNKITVPKTTKPTKSSYSYGNDIEFHLFDVKQKKFVSAIPVLKRDKYDPIDLGDGIKMYYDNILLECSYPPYFSKEEMFSRIKTVISRIQKYLGKNYRIVPKAAHMYDDSEVQDPIAKEIGCSQNFDGWSAEVNHTKNFESNLRTTGYHCHIGGKLLNNFDKKLETVRLLDVYLGTSAVLYNQDETEVERRKLYGCPAEHRPCQWNDIGGVEYRPLSSGILRNKEMVGLTFDLLNYTLKQVEDNKADEIIKKINIDEVKSAITNCNRTQALSVLKKAGLPPELMKRVTKKYNTSNFYKSWGIKA